MTRDDTNSYREKGRAVFLAAIMVLSVVAMATAFSGAAAANVDDIEDLEADDVVVGSDGVDQDVTLVGVDNDDEDEVITIEDVGSATDVVVDEDNGHDASAEVEGDDIEVELGEDSSSDDSIDLVVTHDLSDVDPAEGKEYEAVAASDEEVTATGTFDLLPQFPVDDLEIAGQGDDAVVPEGEDEDVSVVVTNDGDAAEESEVTLDIGDGDVTGEESTGELEPDESTPVTFEEVTGELEQQEDAFDVEVSSVDDITEGDLTIIDPLEDAARIEGDIADGDSNPIDNAEEITLDINATGEEGENILDTSTTFEDFDELEELDVVDRADYDPVADDEFDEYVLEIATAGDSEYELEASLDGFETFDASTIELGPRDVTTDAAIRLDRIDDADRLTVLDEGELDRILEIIEDDGEDFPLEDDDAPVSLEEDRVDADETVDLDIFVESEDLTEFTEPEELEPFANEEGEVEGEIANVDGADEADVELNTDGDTDENGLTTADVSLTADEDELEEDVVVDLEFNASSNADVANDEVTITFVPDVGDTGTISGDVDNISEDRTLGVQDDRSSSVEPADNVPVHAVPMDLIDENRLTISAGEGDAIEGLSTDDLGSLDGIDSFDDGDLDVSYEALLDENNDPVDDDDTPVRLDQDDQIRVVTFDDDGSENVQDPRSDYLVKTEGDFELVQNEDEASPSVQVHDEGDGTESFDIVPLDDDDNYQTQQLVELTNTTSDESVDVWLNTTVDEPDSDRQTESEQTFDAPEDITFDGIEEAFNPDENRIYPTDYTNANGDFELHNMPTTEDYVVIAGAGDAESADGADSVTGFANFAGYDTVTDVSPNADSDSSQLNTDLSVQEFEIDRFFDYDLDVVLEDEDGDLIKEDRIQTGEEVEAIVNVTAIDQDTDEEVSDAAEGQEIDLSLIDQADEDADVNFASLNDTTVEVDEQFDDGQWYATTTFEASELNTGTANISAATENDRDQTFQTGDSGVSLNDESDQAQVEVFDTIEITGDIVNEDDTNIAGAVVELFVIDEDGNPAETIDTTVTGEAGSYVFDGVETGQSLGVNATALDDDGNEVDNTRTFEDGDPVTSSLGGEDIVIVGASPDQQLEEASFSVDNLNPEEATVDQGDELTVTADVENTGEIDATQDISFTIEDDEGDTTELGSQELTLDVAEDDTVEFTVDEVDLEAGDYTHAISSDDESVEGSLTVEGDDDGDNGVDEEYVDDLRDDDGNVGASDLDQAIGDFFDDDINAQTLDAVIAAFFE